MRGKMLIVGLTGGIATGKTTVADYFATLGIPVIDTDVIARELTRPGAPATAQIAEIFGNASLDDAGGLRRDWLRRRIFQDADARRRLEAILHPLIRSEVRTRLEDMDAPYCIVVAPLLFEAEFENEVDRVLVVDADASTQVRRLMDRDGSSDADARAALAAQLSQPERLQRADEVITNNKGLDELDEQVRLLHARYLELAAAAGADH